MVRTMIKFLDLKKQNELVGDELSIALSDIVESAYFIGHPVISEFERKFADFLGIKHCVGVGNGTDALEISLETLMLPKDCEIIVPANSFIATSEAVLRLGHKVVFADVDAETACISPASIRSKITSKTAAVIAVHLYGQPCDMRSIKSLCEENNLKLVEDCAQSHGAKFDGSCVGTFGDIAAFSFYPGKNLGAFGDAGAIVTNSDPLYHRAKMVGNHGRTEKYLHEFAGRNSRLDAIQAAVLNVKLNELGNWLGRRNEIARIYRQEIVNPDVIFFNEIDNCYHSFHLFVVRVPDRSLAERVLTDNQIGFGVHYPVPLHLQPAHAGICKKGDMPVTESLAEEIISLPIGEHLSDEDVKKVASVMNAIRFA